MEKSIFFNEKINGDENEMKKLEKTWISDPKPKTQFPNCDRWSSANNVKSLEFDAFSNNSDYSLQIIIRSFIKESYILIFSQYYTYLIIKKIWKNAIIYLNFGHKVSIQWQYRNHR